ncbi:hypothetical protein [Clostridium sp. JN-9]|uniref:hypothetical protein n=1 Tax=Clostridium sp. JN-9 TaxID=2507159 RepID=UPI000FFE15D3|nr:hypothetical protein [Clostridium sp. JN-9]QAT39383.1 hypothetical protein EQM05_03500 [Clostridium sp. JN-9]
MSKHGCNNGSSGSGLLLLILIVLQFKNHSHEDEHSCERGGVIDNSILFIIVFWFIICCGCNISLCCGN